MEPLVFAQENVAILENEISLIKSTEVPNDHLWCELDESLRYLTENTKLIIDLLKKKVES
jgi:hypothetical protein